MLKSARTRWTASWIVWAVWSVLAKPPLLKRSTSNSRRNMIVLKKRSNPPSSRRWRSRLRYWLLKSRKPMRNVIMPLPKVTLLPRNETGLLWNLETETKMYNCVSIMRSDLPMRRKTRPSTNCKVS